MLEIPLSQLVPHPLNSNVMTAAAFGKLVRQVGRTGNYPCVIVRLETCGVRLEERETVDKGFTSSPKPQAPRPTYQILDGHHRVAALRELGHAAARCEVWDVDDAGAAELLATLNRLRGSDDPHKRATLVAELRRLGRTAGELARALPETRGQIERLAMLRVEPPEPVEPPDVGEMPGAVFFFLTGAERGRLEAALKRVGGKREKALMEMVGNSLL